MADDDIFRLALLAVYLVFIPFGYYFRLRALTGEKIDRWQEGPVILFGLRICGLLICWSVLAWMIRPSWMAWSALPLSVGLRWTGVAILVLGGCLWIWAMRALGTNLTDTVVTREKATLVTGGPYRWVRHPFYTSCLIGLLGVSVLIANWFILGVGCLFWFALLVPRTKIEEQNLIARFGDNYRHHMNRTGRFLPRVRV